MLRALGLHAAGIATAAMASIAVAGCGDEAEYANRDRPPAPITLTASISKDKISVSPKRFGAGPIKLIVTNQTDRSQQITLETADAPGSGRTGIRQQTGPINPRDTASIQADVRQGSYSVRVAGDGIRPATLDVSDERPTSQQDLLLP
jgi:hypothetical protein